jgi:glycosyltransferase involved in cell wall biosynthesis
MSTVDLSARAGTRPRLLVLSSLFPSDVQPMAGLFIRERMFRVAGHAHVVVVAPQAWFPGQGLIRLFRPHFRPMAKMVERMQGVEVYRPRFLSVPLLFKRLDGLSMAVASYLTARRLVRTQGLNLLDAHFGYPDGYAATLLGRWLGLPVLVTLRGKEERQLRLPVADRLREAICRADRLIAVSDALKRVAEQNGVAADRITVIGNGIDLDKFIPMPQREARSLLGLPSDAKVLVSVGTLVERKGFHRVFETLPALLNRHANLHYLVVGGPGPEGDISERLRNQAAALGVAERVHFLGRYPPAELRLPLSAGDVFVLATGYEGWANVFLEAMACGLPVVTTDVGGNSQVVKAPWLGTLVPFGDRSALTNALDDALSREWDRPAIRAHAAENAWDARIPLLLEVFTRTLEDQTRQRAGELSGATR